MTSGGYRRRTSPAAAGPPAATPPGAWEIVFDGGALGNPGKGYGSYQITAPDGTVTRERLDFGDGVTNNQAEYRTLIAALERLGAVLGEDARAATVTVRGDSQLVLYQIRGTWKVKNEGLRPYHRLAVGLVSRFGRVDLVWHARRNSVAVLGH